MFIKEWGKMASVLSINVSEKKGTVKTQVEYGMFKENHGINDDAHSGNWHRQVSLLGVESIEKMQQLGLKEIAYGLFAENITTEGINLYSLPIGTKLNIGEVILEITQIGKECHNGCEIKNIVGHCIMPKEGVFAKVIKGGVIKVGDVINTII